MHNILVIGAGIGGLSAAISLRREGHSVRVFERASIIEEVGAGLGIVSNAMAVLDRLDVGKALRERSPSMEHARTRGDIAST